MSGHAALPHAVSARLEADARVLGAAEVAGAEIDAQSLAGSAVHVVIACRFDARDALLADLPRLLAPDIDLTGARIVIDADGLRAVTRDRLRVTIDVTAQSELRPDRRGEGARVLVDRSGGMQQWVRWSAGRPTDNADDEARAAERALAADRVLRECSGHSGLDDEARFEVARSVAGLDPTHAVDSALQIAAAELRSRRPVPDAGLLLHAGSPADAAFESFLAVADGEGFRGDRVLFEHARDVLARRPGVEVVFEAGWCVPTFDVVAVRFGLGPPIGGCKVPLAPGVAVGVEVTAGDQLAFWAAPAVREATGTMACVRDDGQRAVLDRTAGREAFFEALDHAVTLAADDLPDLLARSRGAASESLTDVEETLRGTHLPLSHRNRVLRRLGGLSCVSRLDLALALTRVARDEEVLGATKLAWAAGRLLTFSDPVAPDAC